MSKLHRLRLSDRIFFVTTNLRRGVPTFGDAEFRLMIEVLEASRLRLGFALYGYVLMPDHWHALIGVCSPLTVSQVIHDVKKTAARRLNKVRGTEGPLWQHQFWDRFVRHADELRERLEYMHQNPVRRKLVSQAVDWQWSSQNNFASDQGMAERCPIQVNIVQFSDQFRG